MKIQIKSDLHMENYIHKTVVYDPQKKSDLYVSPHAEVLVLAGDIINAKETQVDYLINQLKDITIPILYVPGNHEYWDGDYLVVPTFLKEKLKDTNITLMNRGFEVIKSKDGEDVLFAGATMWTSLMHPQRALVAKGTHDFYFIKNLNTEIWTNKHCEEYHYIDLILQRPEFKDMKKVVITHYLPSYFSVPERFRRSDLNCIFVGDCEDIIKSEYGPDLWIHGHTHDSNDYVLYNSKTRVVSNPRGRQGSDTNKNYDNELIIEI